MHGGFREGAGRKPTGEARDAVIIIKVTKEEKKRLQEACLVMNTTMSDLIRGFLRQFWN